MGGGGQHGFLGSGFGQSLLFSNPLTAPAGVINSGIIQPMNKQADQSKKEMQDLSASQQAAAKTLADTISSQPKVTQSDNFLAMKSKALSALRLGFASTSTGASGTPSILPSGLKGKLGA